MRTWDDNAAITAVLGEDRLSPLGPGRPNESMRSVLLQLDIETMFAPHQLIDRAMAKACLAGLWLYHDFLDESHEISQEIHTPTGSYWHAIMHRREPDPSNAKFWFRRVGTHPVLSRLVEQAPALGYKYVNPQKFVDYCELVRDTGTADEGLAKRVQYLEWQLLFDYSHGAAISGSAL